MNLYAIIWRFLKEGVLVAFGKKIKGRFIKGSVSFCVCHTTPTCLLQFCNSPQPESNMDLSQNKSDQMMKCLLTASLLLLI